MSIEDIVLSLGVKSKEKTHAVGKRGLGKIAIHGTQWKKS